MRTTSQYNVEELVADRPAPIIPDCFSVQAVGADPTSPHLTIYRRRQATAVRWIAQVAGRRKFKAYLLRSALNHWEIYNAHGRHEATGSYLPISRAEEAPPVVLVDRAVLLQEACALTDDPGVALLASSEVHAGASAADQSNFRVVCRRMISEADPADLEQVYLLDSKAWPCRVTGVFANVAKLSPPMQDVFLERVTWLQGSLPMVFTDFCDALAGQLAKHRQGYVSDVLRTCGRAARMTEENIHIMVVKWYMGAPGAKHRFALHLVETLSEGLVFQKHAAETFSPEIMQSHGAAVVNNYRSYLVPHRPKHGP